MKEADIECKVVKVLISKDHKDMKRTQLRIVCWVVNGKEMGSVLEKRTLYVNSEGEERMSKAKGITKEEIQFVIDNWAEIAPLL